MIRDAVDLVQKHLKQFFSGAEIALGIVDGDEVAYYGIKWEKDSIIELDNKETLFEIGSISKVFTASLLGMLVERRDFNIDSTIYKTLPIDWKTKDSITFLSLANHTSGLPRMPSNFMNYTADPFNPFKAYDGAALENYLEEHLKLNQSPGSKYEYSNLGMGLLGYLISKITGATYEELLQDNILEPLGMVQTTTDRNAIKGKLAQGLNQVGFPTSHWDFQSLAAAGAIKSSIADLAKFAQVQFTADPSYALTRKKTFKVNNKMSLGFRLAYPSPGCGSSGLLA